MWISEQITAGQTAAPKMQLGEVTGGQKNTVVIRGIAEYRGLPLAGPWGIAYLPPEGAAAVLTPDIGTAVCLGTLTVQKNLQPGELLLYSAGGAEVYLKNSGEVVINGQVFPPKEEE